MNWFKKLRTHIGVWLAREEIDGLREYSYLAEERAREAKHELDTSKEWRLLVNNTMSASGEWREELERKLANAFTESGFNEELDKHVRSQVSASIIYKIIRDALHGYTVDFVRYKDPENAQEFGRVRVDTITFKNNSYVGAFTIATRKPLEAPR